MEEKFVQSPTPIPETSKKNVGLVVGVILVLVSLGVAGIFGYQNYQLKKQVPQAQPTLDPIIVLPSVIPSPTLEPTTSLSAPTIMPTPTTNPLLNWETYSDNNICYVFEYPEEITLKEEGNTIHLSLWGPTQEKDTEFYDGISLNFSLPFQTGNISLKEYVDDKIEESKQNGEILKPREEITINGIKGYTYTSQGLGTFQSIFLQSLDKTCAVEITNGTSDPTNQGYQKTVDKILSTFKFTD